ncbi:response regulator transcription factor [Pseudomonas sp. Q1-7]|uniref:response regulator transcription factor n=1 Tax=Pseudomonas sp. Q1-7 TaxID=3020843 RepID=UPI002301C04C|nr:response regulator [Pseudomonas sp. Q1-7]
MTQDTYKDTTTVIAIVDDDESVREALEGLLRSSGYQARTYSDALDFLESADPNGTHCLISDIQMPGMSGVELHERLVESGVLIPTILITAFPEAAQRAGSALPGVIACLPKPFPADRLLECVEDALRRRH